MNHFVISNEFISLKYLSENFFKYIVIKKNVLGNKIF